jgi:hypothetical protein
MDAMRPSGPTQNSGSAAPSSAVRARDAAITYRASALAGDIRLEDGGIMPVPSFIATLS